MPFSGRLLRSLLAHPALPVMLLLSCANGLAVAETGEVKTLSECVAMALENHPSLKAAQASVHAGEARVREARAPYLPQLAGNYNVSRRRGSARSFTGGTIVEPIPTPVQTR